MYGIFAYIYHKNQPNVGKYTIHGSYGNGMILQAPPQPIPDLPFQWCIGRMDPSPAGEPAWLRSIIEASGEGPVEWETAGWAGFTSRKTLR